MAIRISSGHAWNRRESDTSIVVFPSDDEDRGGVTVRDVLERVHRTFACQIPEAAGVSLRAHRIRPVVWVGMTPSEREREVWVLYVHVV
jgi:hypothetical protein